MDLNTEKTREMHNLYIESYGNLWKPQENNYTFYKKDLKNTFL